MVRYLPSVSTPAIKQITLMVMLLSAAFVVNDLQVVWQCCASSGTTTVERQSIHRGECMYAGVVSAGAGRRTPTRDTHKYNIVVP
jgi:hypothetical protein